MFSSFPSTFLVVQQIILAYFSWFIRMCLYYRQIYQFSEQTLQLAPFQNRFINIQQPLEKHILKLLYWDIVILNDEALQKISDQHNNSFVRFSQFEDMFGNSLADSSKHLSGLSLESFIVDVTSEGENYCFYELLQHPNINTVKPRFIAMLKLFSKGRWSDYAQFLGQHQQLTQKQIFTLRKLSILSEFFGLQTILLSTLQKKLGCPVEEVISLLLKMSIDGSISIKIKQETGLIAIRNAEIRMIPLQQNHVFAMKASIQLIKHKNIGVRRHIAQIKQSANLEGFREYGRIAEY